ncbi:MAG: type IX secretion system membrane protein PorP/SprF [Crocinitomix sp.]|nr:type IX secretion system membrane protein PorP/SprF [Crocinitomix sp.]
MNNRSLKKKLIMLIPKTLTIILLVFSASVYGQQDPLFASEGQRSFWFNPASIGTFNTFSINSIARTQWNGVAGGPASIELNGAFKGLKIGSKETPFSTGAVGLSYRFETIGNSRSNQLTVPLNLQFKLSDSYLSIGISPGLHNLEFPGGWVPPSTDPEVDPAIPPRVNQTQFTAGAGVQWYGRRFSLGLSSTHLTTEKFDALNYQAARHYYVNGSYVHPFNEKFALSAIAVGRADGATASAQGLLSAIFGEKNKVSVGLGYRNGNSVIGAVTARYNKFYVGYFVEYFDSILSNGTFSHEIRIAFELFDESL